MKPLLRTSVGRRAAKLLRVATLVGVPLVVVAGLWIPRATSFVPIQDTMGNYFHWRTIPVGYRINSGGEASVVGEHAEINAAFSAWENLNEAYVAFNNNGNSSANNVNGDGVNRIAFDDPAGDQGGGTLATTYSYYSGPILNEDGQWFGEIVEADIAFNNGVDFATNAEAASGSCFNEFDIRSVATHEIGHLIGLDHPPVSAATMYFSTGPCDPSQASLHNDDVAGAAFLYPTGMAGGPPTANFVGSPSSGPAPLSTAFTDLSSGSVTSWSWNFGDGTTATSPNPVKNYFTAGTYTVTLTVTGPNGNDTETKNNYITVTGGSSNITADFSGSPTSGTAPLTVSFSDQSVPMPTAWSWNFGGTGSSALENPNHTFTTPGCYDITLTVQDGAGNIDTEIKTCFVNVTAATGPPVADFSAGPTRGVGPLTVNFTDLSAGAIDMWSWNFGDGIGSTSPSPTHVFTDPGFYTVTMTASGPQGQDTESKVDYIEVLEAGAGPVADFVADPLQGLPPLSTAFRDLSSGPIDTRVWNFGQGEVTIETSEFGVTFPDPGYYDVSLTVAGVEGTDAIVKNDYIVVLNADGTLPTNPGLDTPGCNCSVVGTTDGSSSSTPAFGLVLLSTFLLAVRFRSRRRRLSHAGRGPAPDWRLN